MAGSSRVVHDWTGGETPASATFDSLPGGMFGFNASTAAITNITTEQTVITVDAKPNSSRMVGIYFRFNCDTANGVGTARIYRDSVLVNAVYTPFFGVVNERTKFDAWSFDGGAPAATHTYKVTLEAGPQGVGPMAVRASSAEPIEIALVDFGAWPLA